MNKLIICLFILRCCNIYGQYSTQYGDIISPKDTLHALNIFINIVFDLCDTCDLTDETPNWIPGAPNSINTSPPVYLANYMDREFNPDNIQGSFTRRYAGASFNNFIVVGDFISVDIAQSKITPGQSHSQITEKMLLDSTIALINQNGGLRTIYDHNSLVYYDGFINTGSTFSPKVPSSPNGNLDLVQFFVRNRTQHFGQLDNGGHGIARVTDSLLVNGVYCFYDFHTITGAVKNRDLANPRINPTEIHELAHGVICANNAAHMGGGIPLNSGDLVTLSSNSGWSIISSAPGCMVSCNGYERWRLGWQREDNDAFPITAGNNDSDIEKSDGNQSLILRDFVTFGDAIRIKFPYVDEGALNQYIWLEYHQVHMNEKIDYPYYYDSDCKDYGVNGIFAYYQVGKDIREGSLNDVSDRRIKLADHLIPICADGRWDIQRFSETADPCMYNDFGLVNIQEYYRENPFCRYHDLQSPHFFNSNPENTLNWKTSGITPIVKKQGDVITNKLSSLGDNGDPFSGTACMKLCSNPAPVTIITYHHTRSKTGLMTKSTRIDNRRIHLTGLRIDMIPIKGKRYKVDIIWDDYHVSNDVIWTGDIVLHERVDLDADVKITFDQNETPDVRIRDSRTNKFSGPTYFTCLTNSEFEMHSGSEVELKNLSSFIVGENSNLKIQDDAVFRIKQGCTLLLKNNADLIISGSGRIEVESGAYICIEPGAHITLEDGLSVINLRPGYISGVNLSVITEYVNCHDAAIMSYEGKGSINSNFITNVSIK